MLTSLLINPPHRSTVPWGTVPPGALAVFYGVIQPIVLIKANRFGGAAAFDLNTGCMVAIVDSALCVPLKNGYHLNGTPIARRDCDDAPMIRTGSAVPRTSVRHGQVWSHSNGHLWLAVNQAPPMCDSQLGCVSIGASEPGRWAYSSDNEDSVWIHDVCYIEPR